MICFNNNDKKNNDKKNNGNDSESSIDENSSESTSEYSSNSLKKVYNTRSKNKKKSSISSSSNNQNSDNDSSSSESDSDDSELDNLNDLFNSNSKFIQLIMPTNMDNLYKNNDLSTNDNTNSIRNLKKRKRPEWAKDLKEKEFKKQIKKFNDIKKYNNKSPIEMSEILTSNLTFEEQCNIIEKLDALKTLIGFEYITLRDTIKKDFNKLKLNRSSQTSITHNKQLDIKELKNKLLKNLKLENNDIPIEDRIMHAEIPIEIKSIIYDKYLQLSPGRSNSDDAKILKWLNLSLRIPYNMKKDNKIYNLSKNLSSDDNIQLFEFLHNTKSKLNKELFAMTKAKDRIIEILFNRIINPNSNSNILALVGPPGIGKTMLMEKISKILEIPMEKMSMGGISDSEFITGTRILYIGSEPGCISKALINMGCTNGILFMDEFDKLSEYTRSGNNNAIAGTLLPIMDFTQNHHWDGDQYFNPIKLNLSHLWFVLSMNDEKLLPEVLRDRIDIIYLDGYNINEKIKIGEKFILNEVFKNLNQNINYYKFENGSIANVIRNIEQNKPNGGVRNIKHFMHSMASKLSLFRLHALFIFSKYGYNKVESFISLPLNKKRKINSQTQLSINNKETQLSVNNKETQLLTDESYTSKKFLSDKQRKILNKILKDTTEHLFEKKSIYISSNTLLLLKDYLISNNSNLSASNIMVKNMYL